eukprot:1473376-Prymnesium_polylepis.2
MCRASGACFHPTVWTSTFTAHQSACEGMRKPSYHSSHCRHEHGIQKHEASKFLFRCAHV